MRKELLKSDGQQICCNNLTIRQLQSRGELPGTQEESMITFDDEVAGEMYFGQAIQDKDWIMQGKSYL